MYRKYVHLKTASLFIDAGKYRISIPPPPASGVVFAFIFNIMLNFYNQNQLDPNNQEDFYHKLIESYKVSIINSDNQGWAPGSPVEPGKTGAFQPEAVEPENRVPIPGDNLVFKFCNSMLDLKDNFVTKNSNSLQFIESYVNDMKLY